MSDLRVLFLWYMVEGMIVSFTGMGMVGVRLNLKQCVIAGVLQGLVVWLVRGIYTINNIPFGTHTFFNLMGLAIILYFVGRRGWGVSMVAALLGFIILILSESLMLPKLWEFLQMTMEQVFANAWVHIAMGYIGDWLLFIVAALLLITKKSLINVDDLQR